MNRNNELKELIIETLVTTTVITALWGVTCSVVISDSDEPSEITILGVKPSLFTCCFGISTITTAGLIWNLINNS
jgi:hypothetical protein